MKPGTPITVALSGGVDSAVTAALLKEQGHDVTGVFMKNWTPLDVQSLTDCPWERDQADAAAVCDALGIPFRSINFEREYYSAVVQQLLDTYSRGETPNPDILCNSAVKFGVFLDDVLQSGSHGMATGHYARLTLDGRDNAPVLRRGIDDSKDQSYFLYRLDADQLRHVHFPLGDLQKTEVRRMAEYYSLPNATKPDSQGICFIGHLDLKTFLKSQLGENCADVCLLPEHGVSLQERIAGAQIIGQTKTAHYLTTGERIGGQLDTKKIRQITGGDAPQLYVVSRDIRSANVYVSTNRLDPHIYTSQVILRDTIATGCDRSLSLLSMVDTLQESMGMQVRYRQTPVPVQSITELAPGVVSVDLVQPIWAAAAGQSAVVYVGDRVLGGGVITNTAEGW
jgi:tRNA-uridine 2-sulfurtransferase